MKTQMINVNLKQAIAAFKLTDTMEMTEELPTVRGWLMDTIETLATPESFEKWIDTDNTDDLITK